MLQVVRDKRDWAPLEPVGWWPSPLEIPTWCLFPRWRRLEDRPAQNRKQQNEKITKNKNNTKTQGKQSNNKNHGRAVTIEVVSNLVLGCHWCHLFIVISSIREIHKSHEK
jgi:hypothetical protein